MNNTYTTTLPNVRVEAHRLGWRGKEALRFVRQVAPDAVRVVEQHFERHLQPVLITLTTPEGIAELACRAEFALAPQTFAEVREETFREAQNNAEGAAARVVLNRDRGVLMFLNYRSKAMRVEEGIETVLAHELVHCDQLDRPGVRDLVVAHTRHAFGHQKLSAECVSSFESVLTEQETEAYLLEDELAAHIRRMRKPPGGLTPPVDSYGQRDWLQADAFTGYHLDHSMYSCEDEETPVLDQ